MSIVVEHVRAAGDLIELLIGKLDQGGNTLDGNDFFVQFKIHSDSLHLTVRRHDDINELDLRLQETW